MIVLLPDAGLCNRMRAIDSAIALSEESNNPLTVYWVKYSGINCSFYDLFEPLPSSIAVVKDLSKKPYYFYDPNNVSNKVASLLIRKFQQLYFDKVIFLDDFPKLTNNKFDFNRLKDHRKILIESHSRFFYPKKDSMYKYFKPLPKIEEKVQAITSQFPQNSIGVHIRRTDNKKSIEQSPFELFVHVMKKELEFNPDTSFFVASDSDTVKTDLAKIFGDKILLATHQEGKRDTEAGIIDAVVDLYALSKTKKILGSYWSSFSHTASHISGIEEIVVRKGALPAIYEV